MFQRFAIQIRAGARVTLSEAKGPCMERNAGILPALETCRPELALSAAKGRWCHKNDLSR